MRNAEASISVQGMICRQCEDALETALIHSRGVIDAKAGYWRGIVKVSYDPYIISQAELEAAIARAGYTVGKADVSGLMIDVFCLAAAAVLIWLIMRLKASFLPMAEAGASLGYVFLLGLLTSTHCVAMCGGIMLSQTTSTELETGKKRSKKGLISSLTYNGGRVFSYTLMGAVFGAVGAVITYTKDFKSMVFTIAGLLVALIGVGMLGIIPGLKRLSPTLPGACELPKKTKRLFQGRPLIIGLLTGIMPCAPLQAMWLYSMSSGNAAEGALAMLIFSLGTVPLMVLFGSISSLIPGKYVKYMLKASAVLIISLGAAMLISGIKLM